MAKTKYYIKLSEHEKAMLNEIVNDPAQPEKTVMRARILLLSDTETGEKMSVSKLAEKLGTTHTTVQTVRAEYGKLGLHEALFPKARIYDVKKRRINDKVREQIVELAGAEPPVGHKRWSLQLLCDEAVKRGIIDSISDYTMANILKDAGMTTKR